MNSVEQLSQQLGELLLKHKQVLVTAESCTGGGVANAITEIAGSSAWFDRAFVTYSNEAKRLFGCAYSSTGESTCSIRPLLITTTRSDSSNASS